MSSVCEGSLTAEQAAHQSSGGGSNPTPSLQNLRVEECPLADVRQFIESHHYSKSVKGVTPAYSFKVTLDGRLVGAAIFGLPAMKETREKYSEFGKCRLLELRRFVMVDDTPRNSESRSIAVMLKILKKHGIERILSYADPAHGHVGTIYKALGFVCLGQTSLGSHIIYKNVAVHHRNNNREKDTNRRWSTRGINRYTDYRNKEQGLRTFTHEIRNALASGDAYYEKEPRKFIYLKDLGT